MRNGGSPDRVNSATRVRHRLGLNTAMRWYISVDSAPVASIAPYYNTAKARITAKNLPHVKGCDGLTQVGAVHREGEERRDLPFWGRTFTVGGCSIFAGATLGETFMA